MSEIKFLGTAGARFVVTKQLKKSGGIWLNLNKTKILIDPGPGSLSNCLSSRPKLNPMDLDAILLSHRHIDHSNDANIMIEAMTNGGFNKKGELFLPKDAIDKEPVVFKYFQDKVEKITILKEKNNYKIKNIAFETPVKHVHGVETYGFNFFIDNKTVSIITDTKYFKDIEEHYKGDILIIFVVLKESKDHIMHLSIEDVKKIILKNKPKICILTHFGMHLLKSKPWFIAEKLSKETGVNVIAADDGRKIDIDQY